MGLWETFGNRRENENHIPRIPTIPRIHSEGREEGNSRDSRDSRDIDSELNGDVPQDKGRGNSRDSRYSRNIVSKLKTPSPLSFLRRAGLVPFLAGASFEVMGLEKLEEIRREKCRQYCREHEREILQELRARERKRHYWKNFHLVWFRAAGLDLSLDKSGQVVWTVMPGFEKLWAFSPGQLPRAVSGALVDIEWRCWRHRCRYRREILAALEPCKG